MSNYKYTSQDKTEVIELLRGIANDLEIPPQTFTYDDLRAITFNLVNKVLGDIDIDVSDYDDQFELSISYDKTIEVDPGFINLDDFNDDISSAIFELSDAEVQDSIDTLNEVNNPD